MKQLVLFIMLLSCTTLFAQKNMSEADFEKVKPGWVDATTFQSFGGYLETVKK